MQLHIHTYAAFVRPGLEYGLSLVRNDVVIAVTGCPPLEMRRLILRHRKYRVLMRSCRIAALMKMHCASFKSTPMVPNETDLSRDRREILKTISVPLDIRPIWRGFGL